MAKLITLGLERPVGLPEQRSNPMENPSVSLGNIGAIWSWISGTEPTASGEIIDEHVALQIISVYSCVRLIAETVSSLPLKLYERLAKGRRAAMDDDLYYLLTVEPNPEMSAIPFWEAVVGCMALCGNAYVYVQRVGGKVVGLWPLNPKKTHPVRLSNGSLVYQTTDGMSNGESRVYDAQDVLHFKLFSWDGLLGLSPIMLARQSLGLTRAAERMGARLFANNGRPSGIMSTDALLDEKALLNIRESWQAAQTGENALKTAFLPGNWKYTALSLDMEAIEFLSTRQFQRSEIAALYRVPAHLIGDTTRQSNTNSEQEMLSLTTLTLRPYLTRIENEIQRVLLSGRRKDMFVEFDVRALLRGDFKTTMEGYAIGRQWGFYNANTILDELGENPIGPIGDVYWVPINYTNAENLLKPPTDTQPQPALDGPAAPEPPLTQSPDEPTADERSVVQHAASLMVIWRDGMGRLLRRSQRDAEAVSAIFEPLVRSMAAIAVGEATRKLDVAWPAEKEEKIVADALKGIAKRSADWTPEAADAIAGEEFRKALRSVVSVVYREAGAASVTEG